MVEASYRMPGGIFRRGDRLTLRAVEPADYPFVAAHWNEPSVRRWFARSEPLAERGVADFVAADDRVAFLVCRDGEAVGFLWFFDVDDVHERAAVGYWIVPEARDEGYATEAVDLGLRWAFDERGLNKVYAHVIEGNDASAAVLRHCGFRKDGDLREHYYVDGSFADAARFAVLRGDRET